MQFRSGSWDGKPRPGPLLEPHAEEEPDRADQASGATVLLLAQECWGTMLGSTGGWRRQEWAGRDKNMEPRGKNKL